MKMRLHHVSSHATQGALTGSHRLVIKSNIDQLRELACQRPRLPSVLARGQAFFFSLARGHVFQASLPERPEAKSSKRTCQRPSVAPPMELAMREVSLIAHHVSANHISEGAAELKWILTGHHTATHTFSFTAWNLSLHSLVITLARAPPI